MMTDTTNHSDNQSSLPGPDTKRPGAEQTTQQPGPQRDQTTQRPGTQRDQATQQPGQTPSSRQPQRTATPGVRDPRISVRPGGHISLRQPDSLPPVTEKPAQEAGSARPTHHPLPSMRPTASGRTQHQSAPYHTHVTDETFTIEGVTYKRESVLSSTTGEAEILLVSHQSQQYVLKLYYQGYYPSAEVLEKIKALNGNGYVVDILSYGQWTSEQGEERFVVLMPYYSGGSLRGGEFRGRPAELEEFAKQAMASINYCHEHGIMHKDIKPNNFLYTDSTRSRIILADFGIASSFARDIQGKVIPFVNINQNRTYIYASPEIFNLTVQRNDGRVEVEYYDVKSDYFALGMTLLVMWMGEAPFALLDERSLLKLKRGERSGLPYPEDIPYHTRNLIRGLTIADPKNRWGEEDFERWTRGEDNDVASANARSNRGLRILYDGSKRRIATSLHQLAEYMLDDPMLGEQYLYSGKVSKWMTEAGMPEWQMRIDSIINKQYPKSRRSGLLALCYKMNPDLPYIGVNGDKCYTPLEIARELAHNAEHYSQTLREWDAPLYVYFNSHNIDTASALQPMFKTDPWIALWRLVYAISPDCEFPLWSTSANGVVWCATIQQIIDEYAASSHERYASFNVRTPIGRYTPLLITDECLVTWLSHRDKDLAAKVHDAVAAEKGHNPELYTYIFYLLDEARNYDYELDTEHHYTHAHIGAMLNQDMVDYLVIGRHNNNQHFYNDQHRRSEQLAHYRDTRLYYYLKSRGDCTQLFEYIDSCFELHSKENRAKTGPYNLRIAALKVCQAMAGETFYYFPLSGITAYSLADLAEVPMAEQQDELRHGFLLEWLAVHYQEDPANDNCSPEEYDTLVMQLMEHLERIDPGRDEVKRFAKCRAEVTSTAQTINQRIKRVVKYKAVLVTLALVIAAMTVVMMLTGVYNMPNDETFSYNWRNMAYLAAPLFVLMMLPPVQRFVNEKTRGFLGSPLLFALVVSNFIVVGWEVLRVYLMPYSNISLPLIYGLLALLVLSAAFVNRRIKRRRYRECINPGFKILVTEPLHFTWRDSGDPYRMFESSVARDSANYGEYLTRLCRRLKSSTVFYSVLTVLLVAGFCTVSLPVSQALGTWLPWNTAQEAADLDQYDPVLYVCTADRAVSVKVKPSEDSASMGTIPTGTLVEVIGSDGRYARIIHDGAIGYVLKSYLQPLE